MYITAKILMRMISRIEVSDPFTYVSADADKGTVTGTTVKWLLLMKSPEIA